MKRNKKQEMLPLKNQIHFSKITVFVIFSVLFLTFVTCLYFLKMNSMSKNNDTMRYKKLTEQIFRDYLSENTLNMHYTIAHPENFGIDSYTPTLSNYNKSGPYEKQAKIENALSILQEISPDSLCQDDQYTYSLLTRSLKNALSLEKYPYYSEPLSPASGTQINLPILLAEYTFRTKQDVEDYLTLLSQFRSYFSELLSYEKEKAAAGCFMSEHSLKSVRAQCDQILTKEDLAEGTHFLQTTFQDRLNILLEKGLLNPAEARAYQAENDRILRTIVLPAYEDLSDGLWLLSDHAKEAKGLACMPDGSSYYETLFRIRTGSYRTMDEIKDLLKEYLYREAKAIDTLLARYPESRQLLSSKDYSVLSGLTPDMMVTNLRNSLRHEFPMPEIISGFSDLPVTIKAVDPNLEAYSAPAFYLSAPMDDSLNNVIYINRENTSEGLELYTTLAHEGYPGHMYQNMYCNLRFLPNKTQWVRSTLWYGGYMEGWAVYVEFRAYDLVAKKLAQNGQMKEAACVLLAKHNRSLWLCLYTLADLMVHHEGADRETLEKLFSPFGITSSDAILAIFHTLVENPCNYPTYYIGYLEILCLKEKARSLWGDAYDEPTFHTFLLDHGPSDFPAIQDALETKCSPGISQEQQNALSQ